jgi:pilus assembly protein Flp/PilA
MSQLFRRLQNALQVEKGQGLVEYALILVMVAVVVISILSIVGPSVGNIFSNIVDNLGGVAVAAVEAEAKEEQPEEEACVDFYSETWHYVWLRTDGGEWVRGGSNDPLPICSWSAYGNNGTYPPGVR